MGISVLLQSVGGQAAAVADLALLLNSSRKAEAEADDGAIVALRRAGISPLGIAAFFDRHRAAAKADGKLLERLGSYAATHPADDDRANRFRAAATYATQPAMSTADWAALKSACSG